MYHVVPLLVALLLLLLLPLLVAILLLLPLLVAILVPPLVATLLPTGAKLLLVLVMPPLATARVRVVLAQLGLLCLRLGASKTSVTIWSPRLRYPPTLPADGTTSRGALPRMTGRSLPGML
jgi:hypothetical protein